MAAPPTSAPPHLRSCDRWRSPLDLGPGGRAFCRILPQVLTDPRRNPRDLAHLFGDTARERSFRLLELHCSGLPKLILDERLYLTQLQVVYAIAAGANLSRCARRRSFAGVVGIFRVKPH